MREELEKLKKEKLIVKKFKSQLNETILSIIFVALTFTIAYQMIDLNSFYYQSNLSNLFGAGTKSTLFYKINNDKDLWNWLTNLFIPNLDKTNWYNGDDLIKDNSLFSDYSSFIIDVPIIKQKRIKSGK